MTPQDTNYDSLSVYYDYLEDNNFFTEELRNNLILSNSFHWCYEYRYNNVGVGGVGFGGFGGIGGGGE